MITTMDDARIGDAGSSGATHHTRRRPLASAGYQPVHRREEDTASVDSPVAAASSHAMLFVVTAAGPQAHRGRPDPVVSASVIRAAVLVMFAVAILETFLL